MGQSLEFYFAPKADEQVRGLWQRVEDAGVSSLATHGHRQHRPHVTFAYAGSFPKAVREDLRGELKLLSIPNVYLSTLSVFANRTNALVLSALVDQELLAVHMAVHDVLAGRVPQPAANSMPGAWTPHCTLAKGLSDSELQTAMMAVHPVDGISAKIAEVCVWDSTSRTADSLWRG
ncbi:2'-5' RNA ligase family protein [Pseudonocardiaceae bacterium YIM PH 21723]|nr:2'-5' RNA ligase family protein [Pseudonocardiaceae bacterium YIM PH 21723]